MRLNAPTYRYSKKLLVYLRGGGVIAYPTESCYGLGCDPQNRRAVQKILKLKGRPQSKGLILIAANYQQVARYILPLDEQGKIRLRQSGMQVVTSLMPAKMDCPRWLRGAHDTLAIRLTAHPVARQLCKSVRHALVSTSANFSGRRALKTYRECQRIFGSKIWVLPGRVGQRKRPSVIRSWNDDKILRS